MAITRENRNYWDMKKGEIFLRHLLAILLLPGTVTVVIPTLLVATDGNRGEGGPGTLGIVGIAAGALLVMAGLLLVAQTVSLFVRLGKGSLAPWDPTVRLVVRGPYRHVRNPMISGVFTILLGEALGLGSLRLLSWALAFAGLNAVYMPLVEEPGLEKRFGRDYASYRRNVPRWIPRRRPWFRRSAGP